MQNNFLAKHIELNYGFFPRTILRVETGVANENFLVDNGTEKYLFKIYKRKSNKDVINEHEILEYLTEQKLLTPRICRTVDGQTFAEYDGRPSTLFQYIEGGVLTDVNEDILEDVGRVLGRLHVAMMGKSFGNTHETWEPADMIRILETECIRIQENGFSNERVKVLAAIKSLDIPTNLPQGMTHQDIKPDNIIVVPNGTLAVIDFGNAYQGTLLYDLMTPIIWTSISEDGLKKERIQRFMQGYEKERRLTNEEKKYFKKALLFRLLREAVIWMWLYNDQEAKNKARQFLSKYQHAAKERVVI